ncbi:hypothetical protein LWI28_013428 [Acer negundo]|uniref:Uncharacterized protein n=1 Tax=Acer negundo TaxID=4023 RepID=A0AAD5I655_ACENE|nr:hypothetical protein LWI28_013428 [Acer negundo]
MAAALTGDDLARSLSSREAWNEPSGVFKQSEREDDEEVQRWVAYERLPTYDRLKKGVLWKILDYGEVVHDEVDVTKLSIQDKKQLKDSILKGLEEDNDKFLRRLRDRIDRMTLLLGPSGSGKTALMLALAGKLGEWRRSKGVFMILLRFLTFV